VYPLCGCNGLFLTAYIAFFLQPTVANQLLVTLRSYVIVCEY